MNRNIAAAENRRLSRNRTLYIFEAGLEYLISLLITDAFLARLLTDNGVSDSAAGIVTELAAFAFSAQLVSVFFRKTRGMKFFITIMHLINQVMFVLLYFVPNINIPGGIKACLIVTMFLGGHIIANVISPYKISWFMSFVPDKTRGRFTANKEIVSLACGTVFSLGMGALSDHYKSTGRTDIYFSICAVTILVLAVLHMLSIIFVKDNEEPPKSQAPHVSFGEALKKTFSNSALFKLIIMECIWQFGSKLSLAYYGVYKINTLGFDMTFVACLTAIGAVSRIAFSRFFGKLADKLSWKIMLKVCYIICVASFLMVVFTKPGGRLFAINIGIGNFRFTYDIYYQHVMFTAYVILHSISMAGINSGMMNIIFDYVPLNDRAPAMGIKSSIGGMVGFLSSFVGGFIIHATQQRGNQLFGAEIYGQQILSTISAVILIGLIIYMTFVVDRMKKQ